MSEKNFQKALLHLYANIDRLGSYSEATFNQFALSLPEQQSLEELMTTHWDGLLLFNGQLREKRRRTIEHALPKSRELASRQLDALLDTYLSATAPEGVRDPDDEVRFFANYAGAQIDSLKDISKELEFIRFEAIYAAVLCRPPATDLDATQAALSTDFRLSLDGEAALIQCTYDVFRAMQDSSRQQISDRQLDPSWLFVFKSRSGEVRTLSVAPGLAGILSMFLRGLSLGEILQTLDNETTKAAAAASIEKLFMLGAPFFSPLPQRLVFDSKK